MTANNLFSKVKITPEGAISMGNVLVCDGYEKDHKVAAFTHIHQDHLGDSFGTCMHNYPVYVSKVTGELLMAITGDSYTYRKQLHIVNYETPQSIRVGSHVSYLTLTESSHVLGASQVLLHTNDDIKILYSGDISPNDHPPKCDVLVIDSTHGGMSFNKQIDSDSIKRRLEDYVLDSVVDKKKAVCVHAHRGKLQHLMSLLSCHPDMPADTKFLSEKIDARVAAVYCRYGLNIREPVILNTYDGDEVVCGGYPWVEFRSTMGYTRKEKEQSVSSVIVSGNMGETTMRENNGMLWLASDEHAELDGILNYVKNADPKVVITDNSCRTKNGVGLAEIIFNKMGIETKAMP